jgi:hypothetical protein
VRKVVANLKKPCAVILTLLYINSEAVIPAKAGIQPRNIGFRVKPGMTNKGKRFLNHCTTVRNVNARLHFFREMLPATKGGWK